MSQGHPLLGPETLYSMGGIDNPRRSTAVPDYSVGFTRDEVEEILRVHKAELKKALAQSRHGAGASRLRSS